MFIKSNNQSYFKQDKLYLALPKKGIMRQLDGELTYYSEILDEEIVVPVGFLTDLGSIPPFLQWIFPKDGLAVFAYVLHDYLYYLNFRDDRNLCDDLLKEAMNSLGVCDWKISCVRVGLKTGGWYAWNKHRERIEKEKIS